MLPGQGGRGGRGAEGGGEILKKSKRTVGNGLRHSIFGVPKITDHRRD
jgi:hypothetical protein